MSGVASPRRFAGERINQSERIALGNGESIVIGGLSEADRELFDNFVPVEIVDYPDVASFADKSNNFLLFFQGGLGECYRDKPVYQRFKAIYPEVALLLQNEFGDNIGDARGLDAGQLQLLLEAYHLMAPLVSLWDLGVEISPENNQTEPGFATDNYYLCR